MTNRRTGLRLGAVLKQAREAKGFSLRQVENETGISNAYLSQLETGKVENPSPRILKNLAEVYEVPYEGFMRSAGYLEPSDPPKRDVFLSHRFSDKEFVRELSADVEGSADSARTLSVWLDEAEVRPGQSLPAMINQGLENSRFIALVMTPEYFKSESGWTDAEWHSALHGDPDNRKGQIIPLLVEDSPYIPYLLRHLRAIDFRGSRYKEGLREFLSVLRDEPLPRPITHRGQLITSGTRIDRSSLIAERAVPDADPDVITETLYCNLLRVERLPKYVYIAPVADGLLKTKGAKRVLPSKSRLKDEIRAAQEDAGVEQSRRFMPAFRLFEGQVVTFHDLEEADNPLAAIIDEKQIAAIDLASFMRNEDLRRLVVSLMNMALGRHMFHAGLIADEEKIGRYFFPPKDGDAHTITWVPRKKKAVRTVAKPVMKDGKVLYWRNLGAYLQFTFLVNKFYLKISPTWVITKDGERPVGGPDISKRVAKWTGPERNLQILYHVRFWTTILKGRGGPISVRAGDQSVEIAPVPAMIQQSYGIIDDQRDLMSQLDEEAAIIAAEEEELADIVLTAEVTVADSDTESETEFTGEDPNGDEINETTA